MTRREFVIQTYGENVVDDGVFGGIQGCPGHYKKLVDADKSIISGESYGACIEPSPRYNIPQLGIQMRPLHCKRYEPTPTIEALDTAVFHLKAQHLTDELIRKIFDEEPKESK